MKNLIIVITLLPAFVFAKNLSWSKKWVNTMNNKTLADSCKKASKRSQGVCAGLKKPMLQDKAKFKYTLESAGTVNVTYKKYSVKMRRTDDPQVYLVNRKSLYLEEIKSIKQLNKEVQKLLPRTDETASQALSRPDHMWISTAYAADIESPSVAVGTALTLLILSQREQEICDNAKKLVKACKPFDKKFVEDLKNLKNDDPEVFAAKVNSKKTASHAELMVIQAAHFTSLFTTVDDSKLNALTKCECKEGLCQIQEKKSSLAEDYNACKANIKSFKALRKGLENVDESVDNLIEETARLESKNASGTPAPFKEDSYKSNSR